jgi:subtilisin family serine protease
MPDDPNARFDKRELWSSVIAIPLLDDFEKYKDEPERLFHVMIDLNLDCLGGRRAAKLKVRRLMNELMGVEEAQRAEKRHNVADQYFFAALTAGEIRALINADQTKPFVDDDFESPKKMATAAAEPEPPSSEPSKPSFVRVEIDADMKSPKERAIFRVWPDFEIEVHITKSISTVKADAAQRSFYAYGTDIVWAVLDSGIDDHPHFVKYENLKISPPLAHRDFTGADAPLTDGKGHGTHVAGIIAGQLATEDGKQVAAAVSDSMDENKQQQRTIESIPSISGMAPQCKLVSLRVLDDNGKGNVSNLIAAITYIQEINGYGRRLLIHGVNMSLGYDFDPKWFACGQSPLCVEVDRLVRSGVVVVVAAGNTGFVYKQGTDQRVFAAGESLTINDPGNADLAITVGSTHRDSPHLYGVSYFSSKGPTGDGRLKPDILAPGEKILSCAAKIKVPATPQAQTFTTSAAAAHQTQNIAWYVQDSGTSMAAPHVSGAIAAFLSIRREFVGRPDEVKRIFLDAATDLRRERYFQGKGLIDLMRAIQSV